MDANKQRGCRMPRLAELQAVAGQITAILLLLFLFTWGGMRACLRAGQPRQQLVGLPLTAGAVLLALAVLWAVLLWKSGWRPWRWLWQNRWLPLLLVAVVVLRLPQWGTFPQDDGLEYYRMLSDACKNFQFSFEYIYLNFRLAAHPTWGLAMLAAIPEFFMPENPNSFWVFQTVLAMVAACCVYNLMAAQPRIGGSGGFWGALAVTCCPMLLGMTAYPSTEAGMGVFCLVVIWAFVRHHYILMLFGALLTATSKEPGVVLLAGFFLGVLVEQLHRQPKGPFARRLWNVLKQPQMVLLWVPGLVLGVGVLYYLFGSSLAWTNIGTALMGENTGGPGTGGNILAHFGYKLLEVAATNFDWLLLLVIVCCLVGRRKSSAAGPLYTAAAGAAGASALLVVFLCVAMQLSYSITRYNMAAELLLDFCAVCLLLETVQGRWKAICSASLALLLAVQGYLSIDPVMKLAFPTVETGGISMARVSYAGGTHMGDYMVYNYQYSYLYRGMEQIFAQYDPAEYDVIILGRNNWTYLTDRLWNTKNKCYTVQAGPDDVFITIYQTENEKWADQHNSGTLKSRAIITWSPDFVGETATPEQKLAQVPAAYTNLEQHIWDGGLAGKIVYYTADYTG